MSAKRFFTKSYGKWILAGEHAVLRGSPALVFPIESAGLELDFIPSPKPLEIHVGGSRGDEFKLLTWGVIESALEHLKRERKELTGDLTLKSNLPVGGGLGASAALCAAMGRWFVSLGWLAEADIYEFSRQLENLFHGESSGVDIAVAISGRGLRFVRDGERTILEPKWRPHFSLCYSGRRGMTSECVSRVKSLFFKNPDLAENLDRQMTKAVALAEEALNLSEDTGLKKLAEAVDLAADCFVRWGLAEGDIARKMVELKKAGALAVKPTGSGDGGYLLALWSGPVPKAFLDEQILV